jgi:hypothetical protein
LEGVRAKAQFNQDVAVGHAKFWATYPDKLGFEAARDKFVEMLRTKDVFPDSEIDGGDREFGE